MWRIVCINRDDRPERWQAVCASYTKHIASSTSISMGAGTTPATDGKGRRVWPLEMERFSAIVDESSGRRGCFLSHQAVVRAAQARGWDHVVVIEDDVEFHGATCSTWAAAAECEPSCDVLLGGASWLLPLPLTATTVGGAAAARGVSRFTGTFFIMYRSSAFAAVLGMGEDVAATKHVDVAIAAHEDLKKCVCIPFACFPVEAVHSDIRGMIVRDGDQCRRAEAQFLS
jgi:hypothetical protein